MLVDIQANQEERTSQEFTAMEVDPPKSNVLRIAKQILVRKAQRLDVDATLARSLPTLRAFSLPDDGK